MASKSNRARDGHRWFQFGVGTIFVATAWIGVSAAVAAYAIRMAPSPPHGPQGGNVPWIIGYFAVSIVALGGGIGTLFGRPLVGAVAAPGIFMTSMVAVRLLWAWF